MARTPDSPDNEVIRELRDSVKELNKTITSEIKSTRKSSWAIIAFAFAQVMIAISALGVQVLGSDHPWIEFFIFAFTIGIVVFIFEVFFKKE